jgi:hypothetical protein
MPTSSPPVTNNCINTIPSLPQHACKHRTCHSPFTCVSTCKTPTPTIHPRVLLQSLVHMSNHRQHVRLASRGLVLLWHETHRTDRTSCRTFRLSCLFVAQLHKSGVHRCVPSFRRRLLEPPLAKEVGHRDRQNISVLREGTEASFLDYFAFMYERRGCRD